LILGAVVLTYTRCHGMPYYDYPDENGLRYWVAFFYSVVVAICWIPAFVLRRVGRFLGQIGVESWPRANGSITGGNVKVIHGWVVDYALAQVDYSYRVSGEYFAGSVTRQYPDEQAAWDFVDAHRDQPIVVRYKGDKAQACALRDDDQGPSWAEGNGIGLFAMVWQHWRDELREVIPDKDRQGGDESSTPHNPDAEEKEKVRNS
jgi:hypothetical protein